MSGLVQYTLSKPRKAPSGEAYCGVCGCYPCLCIALQVIRVDERLAHDPKIRLAREMSDDGVTQ